MSRFGSLLSLAAIAIVSYGQTSTATLQGLVHDSSGAAIPQARVVVANTQTGVNYAVTTNQEGGYVVPLLQPGEYEISVEKTGFRRFVQHSIRLDVQDNRTVDVALSLGELTQEVTVTAEAAPLSTNDATVAASIGTKAIEDLPINGSAGREILSLAQLVPGVNQVWGGAGSLPMWYSPQVGGGRAGQGDVMVDGASLVITDPTPGTLAFGDHPPSPDAVQEFSVQTNSLSAEYGKTTGGVINVVTKQGTNQLHGAAREFLQNNDLNANDFFANRAGIPISSFKHNEFGGSLGGPVYVPRLYNGRNRTFFFVDWEHNIFRQPAVQYTTVPTDAWKQGNFAGLMDGSGNPVTIYDPSTIHQDANGNWVRDPVAGNQIPLNRIDPVASKVMSYFPSPNTPSSNPFTPVNNYYKSLTSDTSFDSLSVRIDHNFSQNWRTYGRFDRYAMIYAPVDYWGNKVSASSDNPIHRYAGVWDNIVTLSPTTIIDVRYSIARFANLASVLTGGFDSSTLGLPASLSAQAGVDEKMFPGFNIAGLASVGSGWAMRYYPTTHNISPSITLMKGSHTIKAGFEYAKYLLNFWQDTGCSNGCFNFASNWTQQSPTISSTTQGFAFASFLYGLGSGSQSNATAAAKSSSYYAGYVQDDWRVTPKLTLNLGIRYEVNTPRTERYNRQSWWDPNVASPIAGQVAGSPNLMGAMEFPTSGQRQQTPTDWSDIGPRLGFAYSVSQKTVLRGGYAMMYAPSPMQAANTDSGAEGFNTSTPWTTSLDGRTPLNYLSNPFPYGYQQPLGSTAGPYSGTYTDLGLGIADSYFYGNGATPRIQQWNLNIQRQLPGDMVLEVGYIANKGNHLEDGESINLNQLDPQYMALGPALNNLVPNPFYGVITNPTSPLSQPMVQAGQLLAPYPQYTSVNPIFAPIGNSTYNALTVRLDKRFSNGFRFLISYAKGKTIDDSDMGGFYAENGSSDHQNVYNRAADRAISTQDVAERFVFSPNYEIPVGHGRRFLGSASPIVNALLGGWQINGVLTLQSGLPVPITQLYNNTGIGSGAQQPNSNGQSARITGGGTAQRIQEWFDVADFSIAAPYTFGTAPRTLPDVRDPGLKNTDLSMFKSFELFKEKLKAQFRGEAFNVLNTPQFGPANPVIGSAAAGSISSLRVPSRQLQLALKLMF